MKKMKCLILTICLFLSGCVFFPMGDGGFRVSGVILNKQQQLINECTVSLESEEGRVYWSPRKIESKFETSFTVSPSEETYILNITCPGYQSNRIKVFYGRSVSPSKPATLGELIMVVNNKHNNGN